MEKDNDLDLVERLDREVVDIEEALIIASGKPEKVQEYKTGIGKIYEDLKDQLKGIESVSSRASKLSEILTRERSDMPTFFTLSEMVDNYFRESIAESGPLGRMILFTAIGLRDNIPLSIMAELDYMVSKVGGIIPIIIDHEKVREVDIEDFVEYKGEDMTRFLVAETYNARGAQAFEQKDYPKARKYYELSLKLFPNSLVYLNNMGNTLDMIGDTDGALKMYDRIIEIEPGMILAYMNKGVVYQRQENYEAALSEYQKALELGPRLWITHLNISKLYQIMGRMDDCRKHFQLAKLFAPDYIDVSQC